MGDGLPDETVVAAGFDDAYVVAAVDTTAQPNSNNASKFYYIIRAFENQKSDRGLPYKGIKGPLSRRQYIAAKAQLHLPEFSWHFEDR